MKYNVITGDTMQESLIDRIFALDEKVYGTIDESFVGSKQNMVDRFRHNPRTFVCLTHGDKLVGYINFFPVKDRLFDQILGPVEFAPPLAGIHDSKDEIIPSPQENVPLHPKAPGMRYTHYAPAGELRRYERRAL